MYGTIARVTVKKDSVARLLALGKEWDERERVRARGYIGSEVLWEDAEEGRACLITRFDTKESYWANARTPEQDTFYQRLRACLEADPEWIDGVFEPWDTPFAKMPAWSRKFTS
jgi:antibiotic biosynthesis monooxygenase (ABM) superfamily enzyme